MSGTGESHSSEINGMGRGTPPTRGRGPLVLTDSEYQGLLEAPPGLKVKRAFLVVLGTLVFLACVVLMGFQVVIQGFDSFPINYEGREIKVNLTPILFLLLSMVGLWLLARGVLFGTDGLRENTNYLPGVSKKRETPLEVGGTTAQVKFRTFATSRLFAALFLALLATVNLLIFGFEITSENETGSWLVLGGPTLFVPTSLLPLLISVGLAIYVVLSTGVIVVSETEHFYVFEEYRGLGLAPWNTEVPKERVRGVYLTNAKLGAKLTWVLPFAIHGGLLLIEGASLLNEFAFGQAFICGTMYLVQALADFLVLLILLLKHQTMLQIHTDEKRYELQFSPPAATPVLRERLEHLFGLDQTPSSREPALEVGVGGPEVLGPGTRNLGRLTNWLRLLVGLALVVIPVLSRVYRVYAGEPLRFVLFISGLIIAFRSFKEDFSSKRHPFTSSFDPASKTLHLWYRWAWMRTTYQFRQVERDDLEVRPWVRDMDVFDYLLWGALSVMLAMDLTSFALLTPSSFDGFPALLGLHVAGFLGVQFFVFLALCDPQWSLLVKTPGALVKVPVPRGAAAGSSGRGKLGDWFHRWNYARKHQKRPIALRLLISFVGWLAGAGFVLGVVLI
ncbi:MAG: hypothetical protein ACTSU5_10415 [Promethearchaeota archaeon]